MVQEKQNAEGTIKKCVFFKGANLSRLTNFIRTIFLRDTPRFDHSTCKKDWLYLYCSGENFIFFKKN